MSDRQNPLDKYSTFSYHFLLMAASNTEAIRKAFSLLSGKGQYDKIIRSPGVRQLGKISDGNIEGFPRIIYANQ